MKIARARSRSALKLYIMVSLSTQMISRKVLRLNQWVSAFSRKQNATILWYENKFRLLKL